MEPSKPKTTYFLMCERRWVYHVLIVVAGLLGAYTYLLRGNVFCNAQTGNVVLMGLALGSGKWSEAVYYLIPISAYLMGAFLSELAPNPIKHRLPIRWDTLLIAIEMLVSLALGFVPLSAPVQISQVAINFIASMQYNTFRQAEGIPMAKPHPANWRGAGQGSVAPAHGRSIAPDEAFAAFCHAAVFPGRRGDWHGILPPAVGKGDLDGAAAARRAALRVPLRGSIR